MARKLRIALLFSFLPCTLLLCQQQKKTGDTLLTEVVVNKKRFRVFNNYVTFGAGPAYNSGIPQLQFAGGLDYNFHILTQYFQAGVLLSGDAFRNYNNTQFHLCYGKRKENNTYHFAYFGGISYSQFYRLQGGKYSRTLDQQPGLYGCVQWIKKITYDVGLGLDVFGDINFKQAVYGIKIDIFFSGAYRGKARR